MVDVLPAVEPATRVLTPSAPPRERAPRRPTVPGPGRTYHPRRVLVPAPAAPPAAPQDAPAAPTAPPAAPQDAPAAPVPVPVPVPPAPVPVPVPPAPRVETPPVVETLPVVETPRSPWRRRHPRVHLVLVLLLGCLVAVGVLVAARGDGVRPAAAPTGLRAPHVRPDTVSLEWPAAARATGYVVRLATDPRMEHVVWSGTVHGTGLEVTGGAVAEDRTYYAVVTSTWHGLPGATTAPLRVHTPPAVPEPATGVRTQADTKGITVTWTPGARGSTFRVLVYTGTGVPTLVTRSDVVAGHSVRLGVRDGASYRVVVRSFRGTLRGPDTAWVTVRTPLARLGKVAAPTTRAVSASSVRVSWQPVRNATGYTVTFAATRTSKQRTVVTTTRTTVTIDGVHPAALGLRRIFYVRVVANRWGRSHRTSPARAATVPTADPRTPVAYRATVATYNLLGVQYEDDEDRTWEKRFSVAGRQLRGVQVVGLQEVLWATTDGKRPVEVVAKAAHLTIAKHPHSSRPCTTEAQPVLYDAHRFTVTRCGYVRLSKDGTHPFSTWVELREKKTGDHVLVVNSHLVAYTDTEPSTSTAVQKLRARQARKVVALVAKHRRHGEPVVLTGDFNSYPGRWRTTPLDVLAGAGYSSAVLTARTETDGSYNTFHGFDGARTSANPIDHVLMSTDVVARSYRVHVTNSAKAPSDHYEVSTVLEVHEKR